MQGNEERALDGKYSETLATASSILVANGQATEAKKLIPIEGGHISDLNYNKIGEEGMRFLERSALVPNLQ